MGAEQVAICCIDNLDSPWPAHSKLGFGMGGRGKAVIPSYKTYWVPHSKPCLLLSGYPFSPVLEEVYIIYIISQKQVLGV